MPRDTDVCTLPGQYLMPAGILSLPIPRFWHTNVFKIELKECVIKCEIKIS